MGGRVDTGPGVGGPPRSIGDFSRLPAHIHTNMEHIFGEMLSLHSTKHTYCSMLMMFGCKTTVHSRSLICFMRIYSPVPGLARSYLTIT